MLSEASWLQIIDNKKENKISAGSVKFIAIY